MITIISGAPGAGKSSLLTFFLKMLYTLENQTLLKACQNRINQLNEKRVNKLDVPSKAPIFADFNVKFQVGYKEYYEPYYTNGYYIGLPNDRMTMQLFPPFAKIFLSEAQRYFDSRRSATFPDFASRAFEMHRHFGMDIYMDVQRVKLIDLNIRELCRHFIEVKSLENETDENGNVISSTWTCYEFNNWPDFEEYLNNGTANYVQITYRHEGNIFDCYNSYAYFEKFLPDDKPNANFNLLEFVSKKDQELLPDSVKAFYKEGEPLEYRKKTDKEKS